jgi:hypothetical protein
MKNTKIQATSEIKKLVNAVLIRLRHQRQIVQYHRSPMRKKEPLLIYQMGKVGSSSIRRSIRSMDTDFYPYHLHYLSGIGYMRRLCLRQSIPLQDHILASIYCRKLVKQSRKTGHQVKVISLVRDPIAKNISQFFQNIDVVYPEFGYREKLKFMNIEELTDDLIAFFITNFVHKDPLVWFDVEMKSIFELDVYQTPFDHARGYRIYENDRCKALVVRLEDLGRCIKKAMSEFIGFPNFQMVNENIGSGKDYADVYKEMKRCINLPDTYLDEMYGSKMARYFYTTSEIDAFKKRWRPSSPR